MVAIFFIFISLILYTPHDIVNSKTEPEQHGDVIKDNEEDVIENRNNRYCNWPKISRQQQEVGKSQNAHSYSKSIQAEPYFFPNLIILNYSKIFSTRSYSKGHHDCSKTNGVEDKMANIKT